MKSSENLQTKIGLFFNDILLLETALTHRSYLNENKTAKISNERLEFLGDAVLELVVSQFLYFKFPNDPEGKLTSYRSKIVQTKTLSAAAVKLGIPKYLKMSKGEAESGGRQNPSLLADSFEALIGAIFLDQGIKKAEDFIYKNLLINYQKIINSQEVIDYKSYYQEIVQAKGLLTPVYKIISESGPDHNKTFVAEVLVNNKRQALGSGHSKQEAQQQAAKAALEKINKGG